MPIIQSVDRALRILELFDDRENELSITEISKRMNLHKSTIHSLLKTLQSHRYIKQNEENGKYSLGLKLFERGNYVIENMDLRTNARKYLESLAFQTKNTVHLVILDGQEGVYIDKVEGHGVTVLYSKVGRRVPIHTSAVGKALVAFKNDREIENILTNYEYTKRTDKTIMNNEEFLSELQSVRHNGFAIDNEENEPGIFCLAVPIMDHTNKVIAAISMSLSSAKAKDEIINEYKTLLKETGEQISVSLGYGYKRI
ncbi:IclR family transcriptional regulator [Metabacillus bambusae]|uniref:IclR family transcriptional regulator n=1 Tax=Metabacillus bambusae TaxID=2795218 RepID=A0ABS3MZA3_9BACI|nr:IclR family transcriptional regulator [Metabacillus bambusae]MBO1511179.1 IclR family transcriptional regulator [Metabacillus bambusae]